MFSGAPPPSSPETPWPTPCCSSTSDEDGMQVLETLRLKDAAAILLTG